MFFWNLPFNILRPQFITLTETAKSESMNKRENCSYSDTHLGFTRIALISKSFIHLGFTRIALITKSFIIVPLRKQLIPN